MPPKEKQNFIIGIMTDDGFQEIPPPQDYDFSENLESPVEQEELDVLDGVSFEFELEVDEDKFKQALLETDGAKMILSLFCICDGTFFFAKSLIDALKSVGCTNIKVRSETIENPEKPWMNCKFIVSGVVWDTNNWRKMHGLPMKRRKR